MRFESEGDANMRLHRSIIRLEDRPVMVEAIASRTHIHVRDLITRDVQGVDLDDPRLNFIPVPLGNINAAEHSLYTARRPARRWKVGLTQEGIYCPHGGLERFWGGEELANTIMGRYPTFLDCLDETECGRDSKAFSRNFALRHGKLLHKRHEVGFLEDDEIILMSQFEYLTEKLAVEMH